MQLQSWCVAFISNPPPPFFHIGALINATFCSDNWFVLGKKKHVFFQEDNEPEHTTILCKDSAQEGYWWSAPVHKLASTIMPLKPSCSSLSVDRRVKRKLLTSEQHTLICHFISYPLLVPCCNHFASATALPLQIQQGTGVPLRFWAILTWMCSQQITSQT